MPSTAASCVPMTACMHANLPVRECFVQLDNVSIYSIQFHIIHCACMTHFVQACKQGFTIFIWSTGVLDTSDCMGLHKLVAQSFYCNCAAMLLVQSVHPWPWFSGCYSAS